jgi:hypothetical protein
VTSPVRRTRPPASVTAAIRAWSSEVRSGLKPPAARYADARIPRFAPCTCGCGPSPNPYIAANAAAVCSGCPAQSVTVTVPSTTSQPSSAWPTWRRSQPGGTTVSASVVASQTAAGSVPAVRRSSAARPAARAAPTLRARILMTWAP